MKTTVKILAVGLAAAGWIWAITGCEEVDTDSALGISPAKAQITSKGSTVIMTAFDPDGGVYTFSPTPDGYSEEFIDETAAKGADSDAYTSTNLSAQIMLPLVWEVSNPGLGRIASSAGYTAIYESYGGEGQNYVTVQDQFQRKGVAVVNQTILVITNPLAEVIVVSPASADLPATGGSVAFTAEGATTDIFPLEWSVSSSRLGRILSSAGNTAVYQSDGGVGQNAVTVRAQNGQTGTAVVNHSADDTPAPPAPPIPAISPPSTTLASAGATQVFSVENVSSTDLPLVWTVSNPWLGRILSSSGNTAIYERYAERGNNIITATTRGGQRATAVVAQP